VFPLDVVRRDAWREEGKKAFQLSCLHSNFWQIQLEKACRRYMLVPAPHLRSACTKPRKVEARGCGPGSRRRRATWRVELRTVARQSLQVRLLWGNLIRKRIETSSLEIEGLRTNSCLPNSSRRQKGTDYNLRCRCS
jgi:hypothetical protein